MILRRMKLHFVPCFICCLLSCSGDLTLSQLTPFAEGYAIYHNPDGIDDLNSFYVVSEKDRSRQRITLNMLRPYFHQRRTGKKKIQFHSFSDGLAAVEFSYFKSSFKTAFINTNGAVVFIKNGMFGDFYSGVSLSGVLPTDRINQYFINRSGQRISPVYNIAGSFSEGVAPVCLIAKKYRSTNGLSSISYCKTRWGFVNRNWEVVIPAGFDHAQSFSEGLAAVRLGSGWQFIRHWTREGIKRRLRFMDSGQYAIVGGHWGFINKSGKVVIPAKYTEVLPFSNGLAAVKVGGYSIAFLLPYMPVQWLPVDKVIGGKWGFIDRTGKIVIAPKYDEVRSFSNGLAAVRIGSVWKQMQNTSFVWYPKRFKVLVGGKWAFIDRRGRTVIQPSYDSVRDFSGGYAPAATGNYFLDSYSVSRAGIWNVGFIGRWGVVDRKGLWVEPARNYSVEWLQRGRGMVNRNGRMKAIKFIQ